MRCPYCGGLNPDQAQFCIRCGRDVTVKPAAATTARPRAPYPSPQPQQAPRTPSPAQGYPRPTMPQPPPYQQPRPVPAAPVVPPAATRRPVAPHPSPPPPAPVVPESPAPFPPRTIQQLRLLEQGALNYDLQSEVESVGRKKTLRIIYQRCAPWQQVATLLKALREHSADTFNTILIQGTYNEESNVYGFTNGQLQFDHNVRLGSQVMNRYQIETGNGFESNSVRIVLSE